MPLQSSALENSERHHDW